LLEDSRRWFAERADVFACFEYSRTTKHPETRHKKRTRLRDSLVSRLAFRFGEPILRNERHHYNNGSTEAGATRVTGGVGHTLRLPPTSRLQRRALTLDQFKSLIARGEKATVDFKIVCNAFDRQRGDCDKAKAELVKDICAMANNGNVASYIIIGVADDRKTFQSVTNQHLTSQNIQTLIRDSIHPLPNLRAHNLVWKHAPGGLAGVRFLVIQIGPNAKHAFRFSKDFVDWSGRYHFRKNDVWVRNADTSDLATPEQIGRLLGLKRIQDDEPHPDYENVEYQKLALSEQLSRLAKDTDKVFEEIGAKTIAIPHKSSFMSYDKCSFRVRIVVRKKPFVFRCEFRTKLATKDEKHFTMHDCWSCEHAVLVFVIGAFTAAGKFSNVEVDTKASWGTLNLLQPKNHAFFRRNVPGEFGECSVGVMTLPRLASTKVLRGSLMELFKDLERDDVLFEHLERARLGINKELAVWCRKPRTKLREAFHESFASSEESSKFQRAAASVLALARETRARRSSDYRTK
jgi:hypothetical protein